MLTTFIPADYDHPTNLASLVLPQTLKQTYASLLALLLKVFTTTMQFMILIIRRPSSLYFPCTLPFHASPASLSSPGKRNLLQVTGEAGGEFRKTLNTLRMICVRSFSEALVDVRTAAMGAGAAGRKVGTSIAPITRQVRISELAQILSHLIH